MGLKLHNLLVPVEAGQLAAMMAFYRDGLEMTLRAEGPGWAWLETGPVKLMLHTVSEERSEFRRTGHGFCLEFITLNLDEACAKAEAAGGTRISAWRDGALTYAGVADPAGNMIELFEAPPGAFPPAAYP